MAILPPPWSCEGSFGTAVSKLEIIETKFAFLHIQEHTIRVCKILFKNCKPLVKNCQKTLGGGWVKCSDSHCVFDSMLSLAHGTQSTSILTLTDICLLAIAISCYPIIPGAGAWMIKRNAAVNSSRVILSPVAVL